MNSIFLITDTRMFTFVLSAISSTQLWYYH